MILQGLRLPDFVQVVPELHRTGIRAKLREIRPHEHFAVHHLWTALAKCWVHWTLVGGTPCLKSTGCDVVLKQFVIDNVDDCRDQLFDVL